MLHSSPCINCGDRCADPNCHNVDFCDKWAKYVQIKDADKAKVIKARNKYADEARQVRESKERVRKHRHKQQ
jgi:RNA polymerase subunit RPABC4/transcription elongation factor Spt4